MKHITILVLDASTGIAHQYPVEAFTDYQAEDIEELIQKAGHRLTDVDWMELKEYKVEHPWQITHHSIISDVKTIICKKETL